MDLATGLHAGIACGTAEIADQQVARVHQIGVARGGLALQRADLGLDRNVHRTDVIGGKEEGLAARDVRRADGGRVEDRPAERGDIGRMALRRRNRLFDPDAAAQAVLLGRDQQGQPGDPHRQVDAGRIRGGNQLRRNRRGRVQQRGKAQRDVAERRQGVAIDRAATALTVVGQVIGADRVGDRRPVNRHLDHVAKGIGAGQDDLGFLRDRGRADGVQADVALARRLGHIGVHPRPGGQQTIAGLGHVDVQFVARGPDLPGPCGQGDRIGRDVGTRQRGGGILGPDRDVLVVGVELVQQVDAIQDAQRRFQRDVAARIDVAQDHVAVGRVDIDVVIAIRPGGQRDPARARTGARATRFDLERVRGAADAAIGAQADVIGLDLDEGVVGGIDDVGVSARGEEINISRLREDGVDHRIAVGFPKPDVFGRAGGHVVDRAAGDVIPQPLGR